MQIPVGASVERPDQPGNCGGFSLTTVLRLGTVRCRAINPEMQVRPQAKSCPPNWNANRTSETVLARNQSGRREVAWGASPPRSVIELI